MAQKYSRLELLERVRDTLNRYSMLDGADKILVGLSGGADSVALLRLLLELDLRLEIEAAHINHCLRGAEADGDEKFVRELCQNLGVRLHTLKADVASRASELGQGIEECARNIRYEYFKSVSGADTRIATAHTLGDSAETVLFNIARGCSINGLVGIPYRRGGIIRPIRNVERRELELYLEELGQDYRTDSTNFTLDYTRNKLRLDIMPRLMTINSALVRSVTALSERAAAAMEIISAAVVEILGESRESFDRQSLLDAGVALRRECIAEILRRVGAKPNSRHIELVDGLITAGSGAVDISKTHRLAIEGDSLVYIPQNVGAAYFEYSVSLGEKPIELNLYGDRAIRLSVLRMAIEGDSLVYIPQNVGAAYFEYSVSLGEKPIELNLYGDRAIRLSVLRIAEQCGAKKNYFMCDALPVALTLRQPKAEDRFIYQNGEHSLMYLYRRGSKGKTAAEISEKFVISVGDELVFAESLGASDRARQGAYTVVCE